jgi:hypothetical protein
LAEKRCIAVIGGSGAQGRGLALRWAAAGHEVIIGSRDPQKGEPNLAAAQRASIVVLAVPYAAQLDTVREIRPALAGKILVDVTVPLVPPKVGTVQLPEGGSCVVRVQKELGDEVRVVSAFQNVSAHKLADLDKKIACDVLVCADQREARRTVMQLCADAGLRGIDAGPLANSAAAEALTSLLIWINRTYKIPDAGIAITGL